MTDPSADDRNAEDRGGDFLTVEQMARLRSVTPAAIRAQLRAGTLAGEQVLQGQRTVWRIPASAARRSREEPGGPVAAPDPVEAPPAGVRAAAPVAPSVPEQTPPVTGSAVPHPPAVPSAGRVAALESEVRRLRRQVSALADAHRRLLDALTADLAEDPPR